MFQFTIDEQLLLKDMRSRIPDRSYALTFLKNSITEGDDLAQLVQSLISKLSRMTDQDYQKIDLLDTFII